MFRFYRKPMKGVVGVDISSTSIRLLEIAIKNNRYCVESYARLPLPENSVVEKNIFDPETVGEILERVFNLANPASAQAAFAVPTSMVIHKVVEMDLDMTDDEREVQIRMDAEQYIPFPLDEVSLDFEVLPEILQAGRVQVRLVASRTEHVETRAEVIELAGLKAKIADVESDAIERAFQAFAQSLPPNAKTVAVLDVGHTTTTLMVMHEAKMIYQREQVFGGHDITAQLRNRYGLAIAECNVNQARSLPDDFNCDVLQPFTELLIQQAARALQFFFSSSQFNQIDHLLLAGGTAHIEGLAKRLQQKLGYRVSIANPFLQMSCSSQVDLKKLQQDAPSLLVACGLALRSFD